MKLVERIANSLRKAFTRGPQKVTRPPFKIVANGRGGVRPGVNLDDTSALLDLMDGLPPENKR
ncbi:MAG: hypothetical protein ABSA96_15420 [Candidatus Acidiferrales bacterium]